MGYMLTISGSFGHSILENNLPSFLALANMFHVSICSLGDWETTKTKSALILYNRRKYENQATLPEIGWQQIMCHHLIEIIKSLCSTFCEFRSFVPYLYLYESTLAYIEITETWIRCRFILHLKQLTNSPVNAVNLDCTKGIFFRNKVITSEPSLTLLSISR